MKRILLLFLVFVLCGCFQSIEKDNTTIEKELQNRYDMPFTIKEIVIDDEEAYAGFADSEEGKSCYFLLENNHLYDNYSIHAYEDEIIDLVKEKMEKYPIEGDISVEYSVYGKQLKGKQDANQLLHDSNCEIWFYLHVDRNNSVSKIRDWMKFLYNQDYKWYFEVYNGDDLIFTLDPLDYGYSSEKEWTDEKIENSLK